MAHLVGEGSVSSCHRISAARGLLAEWVALSLLPLSDAIDVLLHSLDPLGRTRPQLFRKLAAAVMGTSKPPSRKSSAAPWLEH